MGRKADALFSLIVRARGNCVALGRAVVTVVDEDGNVVGMETHLCAGPLQCAHIVSRRYRSTRWDEDNAVPLCAGAHRYFTDRQCEWDMFVERYLMTQAGYDEMRYYRALKRWDGDIEGVLVRLAARAVALGIPANPGAAKPEEGAK